jgi:hypothetical protein
MPGLPSGLTLKKAPGQPFTGGAPAARH